jgi:hypothetical protein
MFCEIHTNIQGLKSKPRKNQQMKVSSPPHFSLCSVSGGFFLGLLFGSEDKGDMVL